MPYIMTSNVSQKKSYVITSEATRVIHSGYTVNSEG